MRLLPGPYSTWESAKWLWRNAFGPAAGPPLRQAVLPPEVNFAPITEGCTVTFFGDLMPLHGCVLQIAPALQRLLDSSDFLVANFEGTRTTRRKRFFWDQVHGPDFPARLAELFPAAHTFLSLANNHAGDFGQADFQHTADVLRAQGFQVFGTTEVPYAAPVPQVRIVTGTAWYNRPAGRACAVALRDAETHAEAASLNLLYPHWGYELERRPRAGMLRQAQDWLQAFDAVIGQHAHVPQPVVGLKTAAGRMAPVAFSLGNFCYGGISPYYRSGLICQLDLGPSTANEDHGKWVIGGMRWREIKAQKSRRQLEIGLS